MQKTIPIIVGPTASGKSSFALKLAKHIEGEIVNADALQVYQDLTILSARPTFDEQQGIGIFVKEAWNDRRGCTN